MLCIIVLQIICDERLIERTLGFLDDFFEDLESLFKRVHFFIDNIKENIEIKLYLLLHMEGYQAFFLLFS